VLASRTSCRVVGDRVDEGNDCVDVAAEGDELAKCVRACDEQAGVDRASDDGGDGDLGDDGNATDVANVSAGQAAARFAQQHNAVRLVLTHDDGAEPEVARAAQYDQQQPGGRIAELVEPPGVDHGNVRGVGRSRDEREARCDADWRARLLGEAEAEQRRCAAHVGGDKLSHSGAGCEERGCGCDRACAATAPSADDRDCLFSHRDRPPRRRVQV
jgi:hypothetical protein